MGLGADALHGGSRHRSPARTPATAQPRFVTGFARVAHRAELNAIVTERFAASDSTKVRSALDEIGIANAGLNDVEGFLAHHSVPAARGRWRDMPIPRGPQVPALLPPTDLAGLVPRKDAVPAVGEHTEPTLTELGYGPAEIEALRAEGAL
ncbi:CoA transferase [Streptomyces sp. NPDC002589]|uniref:CoA transferase n=1 Tax=Streptomyces sp. NPDC002589 TaxID=3154420 RepID=UPI003331F9FA